MYDIIGDVHGYASLLKKLLLQLGYEKSENGYKHPTRKAVFVGDFVNRGPEIRKTIRIIRKMVENGNAFAIIGNHEINAIVYYLKDKDGSPLIKTPGKNFLSLYKTINQFSAYAEEWKSHREWMQELPLYLDLTEIRIVHACWSETAIDTLKMAEAEGRSRKSIFRKAYKKAKSPISKSVSILTKGIDFKMPGDLKIINNKGVSPRSFRMRWWEETTGKTFEEISFESKFTLPQYEIPKQIVIQNNPYPEDAPIVFLGHYCRHNGPHIVKPNICCVDSCVAGTKILTAYQWNGEKELDANNLVHVKK
ncbi:MAG TPA: metallophosphoesterase [Bacteroidia bacterium]|nr:metallophosphoesterase [Bacteroidia bacterium]